MDKVFNLTFSETKLASFHIFNHEEIMELIRSIYLENFLITAIKNTLKQHSAQDIKGKELKELISDFKSMQSCWHIADSYELVEIAHCAHNQGVAIVKGVLLNFSKEAQKEFLSATDALNI
jgi:hypothetical protein